MITAHQVVARHFLRFPTEAAAFPGRTEAKPYVIDTRGAGADRGLRALIVEALRDKAHLSPAFDVVAGVSKSGTIWAAWLAWAEETPFANVLLDGPRTSGLQREVEGDVNGRRVLLIDNWVRSGNSIRKAAAVVARAGGSPVAAIAIARTGILDLGLPFHAAWDVAELLEAARQQGLWVPPVSTAADPANNLSV